MRYLSRLIFFFILSLAVLVPSAFAQFTFEGDKPAVGTERNVGGYGPQLGSSQQQTWRAGIIIQPGSQIENASVTIPVPMEWPEQQILKITDEKTDAALSGNIQYRFYRNGNSAGIRLEEANKIYDKGVKEMILKLGRMRPHRQVEVIVEFDLLNYEILPPKNTEDYVIPKLAPYGLEAYLKPGPTIESNKNEFLKMFNEITKDKTTDWDKVEALYSYVQTNVKYDEAGKKHEAKGALAVIKMPEGTWTGDCKDMSCLFVALCRAGKIPARIVRLPEHCYAEFYLELKPELAKDIPLEKSKKPANPPGFWFPCQVAGAYSFGGIPERQPILQKGDSFPDPDKGARGKTLFLKECFEGALTPDSPAPKFQWIHETKVN